MQKIILTLIFALSFTCSAVKSVGTKEQYKETETKVKISNSKRLRASCCSWGACLPPGSYYNSCTNCEVCTWWDDGVKDDLSCSCPDGHGGQKISTLQEPWTISCGNDGTQNCAGILTCGACPS